jgi:MoaA/NifB/PqqE/SkfB family radical SAM enzyme
MKVFYDPRRDSYRFSGEVVDYFINVGLQVTRKCNLSCKYCSEAGVMRDSSLSDIKKIVDNLISGGLERICITGGEPLLRDDLEDILRYIKERNVTITLSTNGMCLDENRLKKIKPLIDNIRFSLRGSEKIHNRITGNGLSFKKTLESIRICRKHGLPISMVMTIVDNNYTQMEEIARICEREGVEKLYYFSLIPRGRAIKIFDQKNVSIDKIYREYNRITELSRVEGWDLEIKVANFTIEGECVLVFPNGDMVGVPSFESVCNQMVLGNILKDDPVDLWKKYPFKENYINYYRSH